MFVSSKTDHVMPETALHFSEVTFAFGKRKPLFEDLSCSLANDSGAGKVIALMGPSGVGKTTFCDLALGIRRPQKGTIEFAPQHANIAVIPQKGVIFDELSVKDNVTCLKYSKSLGASFHQDKVQHAIESLGLSHVLENGTRASALSGGEAQRVMLARIQTIDCDVLILDEPCSFLDNRVKESFLGALRVTVDESRLLALFVTHVWDEARSVADEVVFFHQAPGSPVTLYTHTVTDAQNAPPTVDALFGIHWPDCLIFDLSKQPLLSGIPTQDIPNNTRYVGLFKSATHNVEQILWSTQLWTDSRNSLHAGGRPLFHTDAPSRGKEFGISTIFYDADGLFINVFNKGL